MQAVPRRRSIIAALAVLIAIGLYWLLQPPFGEAAATVSILPIAVIATLYGTRAGLIASAVAFPFNTFLLQAVFNAETGVSLISSLVSVSLFGVAWLFGRFHSMRVKLAAAIKARRRAEVALKVTEERLRSFLETTPDLIFRLGPEGRLLELQGEHNLATDLKKEDYLFRPLDSLLPSAVAAQIVREAGRAEPGSRHSVTVPFPLADGERLMEVTLVPSGDREVMVMARPVETQRANEPLP